MFNNWKCTCSLSGFPIDSPFINLLSIANNVSNIGINNIKIGIRNDVSVAVLNPNNDITATINPKNILPVSPIKMLAGLKLYFKNPRVDPNIMRQSINPKLSVLPNNMEIIIIVIKYIELVPAARPSKPSIKLIEFIHATVINNDNGYAHYPKFIFIPKNDNSLI